MLECDEPHDRDSKERENVFTWRNEKKKKGFVEVVLK